jgi:heme-degrading monooxygenase HmoA
MIERHVTFEVIPEKGMEFERYFVDYYRPVMSTMPGFVRVELLRKLEEPNQYQMVIRFQSAEESDAWRSSTEHQTLSPKLKALYSDSKVEVYKAVA